MKKRELLAELFRVKGLLLDALLDEMGRGGRNTEFYASIRKIWKDMDDKDYK